MEPHHPQLQPQTPPSSRVDPRKQALLEARFFGGGHQPQHLQHQQQQLGPPPPPSPAAHTAAPGAAAPGTHVHLQPATPPPTTPPTPPPGGGPSPNGRDAQRLDEAHHPGNGDHSGGHRQGL